ncbi:MAG: EamA family transporter RarD [Gammaproteobacteria bacterium]|nr:EamA family transporter RarD [Gammaproteobacteria bacterium]
MLSFSNTYQGLISGFIAYSMWGIFPLFFHLLRDVPSTEVLMHRVIWSFIFVGLIITLIGQKNRLIESLKTPGLIKGLAVSSLLVSVNWLIYIWSVAQGRVLESSLGYFLTPLVSVFLAQVFLKEQLNFSRQLAIVLASIGILWLIIRLGYLPWISLSLALSFGLYGLARKQLPVDTLTGLSIETGIMLPFALSYWAYLLWQQDSLFYIAGSDLTLLFMVSGVVTALPLLLFASATKKLSLSAIGFMMYINPTLQFLIAVFILQESFDSDQLIGFIFIWCALLVFTFGSLKKQASTE